MSNIFNDDFRDFINALNQSEVEYILVGGYSVILHGYSRNTGDLDLWVNRTRENYNKLTTAFYNFGMPVFDMTEFNFLNNSQFNVFSFGKPPVSIDIMTEVKGLSFDTAYQASNIIKIENLSVRLINLNDLLKAKKSSGRPKDLDDIENLSEKE
jgi:hypothetical protein